MLLSLNLDPCCAQETRTARRKTSEKEGLLAEMRRASSGGSVKSMGDALCAGESCCSPPQGELVDAVTKMNVCGVEANSKYVKEGLDRCEEDTSSVVDDKAPAPDCSRGCCSESAVEPIVVAAPLDDCRKGCCSNPISTPSDRKSSLDGCE